LSYNLIIKKRKKMKKFFVFLLLAVTMCLVAPPPAKAIVINNPNGAKVYFQSLLPGEVASGDSTIITLLRAINQVQVDEIGSTTTDTLLNTTSITLQFADSGSGWYKIYNVPGGLQDSINAADGITLSLSTGGAGTLEDFYIVATSATKLYMIRSYWAEE